MIKFPRHEASLSLSHNEHRDAYETVEDHYADYRHPGEWINEQQKAKAIAAQDVWSLHWYPDTPVGFICLLAHDLDDLLEAALDAEKK